MQGARSGGLAVFVWTIVNSLDRNWSDTDVAELQLAVTTLVMALLLPIPQFVVLLIAGGLGACFLKTDS